MFPRALVVKVVNGVVTFAVRTDDNRVDEFWYFVDAFRDVLKACKVDGNNVHMYLPVTATYKIVFSVDKPTFDVMVAEFEAQVGG